MDLSGIKSPIQLNSSYSLGRLTESPSQLPGSPNQGQLTGLPRIVKDRCADFYNQTEKWKELNYDGMNLIKNIANMQLNSQNAKLSPEQQHDQLQKMTSELQKIVNSMGAVADKMRQMSICMEETVKLEEHERASGIRTTNLFKLTSSSPISQIFSDIESMYSKELAVKKVIVQNVALETDRNKLMLYSASWQHQPYIKDHSRTMLETLKDGVGL